MSHGMFSFIFSIIRNFVKYLSQIILTIQTKYCIIFINILIFMLTIINKNEEAYFYGGKQIQIY